MSERAAGAKHGQVRSSAGQVSPARRTAFAILLKLESERRGHSDERPGHAVEPSSGTNELPSEAEEPQIQSDEQSIQFHEQPTQSDEFEETTEETGRSHLHSDDLLRDRRVCALGLADRNLTTTLVMGVLRWQLALDGLIRPLLHRPNARLDTEVRLALRLGAYQLLYLDRIPARAVLSETVALVREVGHHFACGMVNAVLRKLATETAARATRLRARDAYPEWMVERWVDFYGAPMAETICEQGQRQAVSTVRLTDASVESELEGVQLDAGRLLNCARHVVAGDVTSQAAFAAGRVRIQDEGSQLVAEIAAAGLRGRSAGSILDMCAAPGGKTFILAERHEEARVVACDASLRRLERLRERIQRMDGAQAGVHDGPERGVLSRIECRQVDATMARDGTPAEGSFDVVLADVPCSGTGTLGRNPEIRVRLSLEDVQRQAEKQKAILRNALAEVRRGGVVVYSTCSLEPEENEQVIAAVLGEMGGDGGGRVRQLALGPMIDSLAADGRLIPAAVEALKGCISAHGSLTLLPGAFSTDGFFVSMLERTN